MKTKFSKRLEWLEPFFYSVGDLVPLHRVRKLSCYKISVKQLEWTDAVILRWGNNKTFDIRIRTHGHKYKVIGKNKNYRKVTGYDERYIAVILDGLAHELSHLVNWDHTPEHFELQAKILLRFAEVLKKLDVKDTWARYPY